MFHECQINALKKLYLIIMNYMQYLLFFFCLLVMLGALIKLSKSQKLINPNKKMTTHSYQIKLINYVHGNHYQP
jgi:hypothetical protein